MSDAKQQPISTDDQDLENYIALSLPHTNCPQMSTLFSARLYGRNESSPDRAIVCDIQDRRREITGLNDPTALKGYILTKSTLSPETADSLSRQLCALSAKACTGDKSTLAIYQKEDMPVDEAVGASFCTSFIKLKSQFKALITLANTDSAQLIAQEKPAETKSPAAPELTFPKVNLSEYKHHPIKRLKSSQTKLLSSENDGLSLDSQGDVYQRQLETAAQKLNIPVTSNKHLIDYAKREWGITLDPNVEKTSTLSDTSNEPQTKSLHELLEKLCALPDDTQVKDDRPKKAQQPPSQTSSRSCWNPFRFFGKQDTWGKAQTTLGSAVITTLYLGVILKVQDNKLAANLGESLILRGNASAVATGAIGDALIVLTLILAMLTLKSLVCSPCTRGASQDDNRTASDLSA